MNWRAVLPWALLAVYLAVCASAAVLEARGGPALVLCPVRATTGLPCPTCGATRATLGLATGNVREALHLNPLITAAWLLAPVAAAAFLLLRGRCLSLGERARVRLRRAGFSLLLAALAANWVYLLNRPHPLPEPPRVSASAAER